MPSLSASPTGRAVTTASPTPAATSLPTAVPTPPGPPRNGSIAFIRYNAGQPSVWLIEPDGTNERILAADLLAGTRPAWTCLAEDRALTAWSPNGEWLAFGVGQGQTCAAQFGLVRHDGTGLRMIGDAIALAWSASSREYVLARNIDAGFNIGHELHFADLEGQATRDPIGGGEPIVNYHHVPPGDSPRVVIDANAPVFSPDGTRLAYAAQAFPPGAGSRTQVVDLENSKILDLGLGMPNAWSPDGKRVLVERSGGSVVIGFSTGIYDVAADGTGERLVEEGALANPVWSPDGRLIAYISGASVIVAAADGSERVVVPAVAAPQVGTALEWSPDGQWLVFSLERGLITTIYICARDGTGLRPLTRGEAPAWQPMLD